MVSVDAPRAAAMRSLPRTSGRLQVTLLLPWLGVKRRDCVASAESDPVARRCHSLPRSRTGPNRTTRFGRLCWGSSIVIGHLRIVATP